MKVVKFILLGIGLLVSTSLFDRTQLVVEKTASKEIYVQFMALGKLGNAFQRNVSLVNVIKRLNIIF